jgi:hypothetical protein
MNPLHGLKPVVSDLCIIWLFALFVDVSPHYFFIDFSN